MIPLKLYSVSFLILAALVCGCCISLPVDGPVVSPSPLAGTPKVIQVSSMDEIDAALANGPALVKFGSESCYWCVEMVPVLAELSISYPGIAVLDVDTAQSRALSKAFYINYIPQVNIIVRKNPDGSYMYVDAKGDPSDSILNSRIVGYTTADKLSKPIEAALALRNSS